MRQERAGSVAATYLYLAGVLLLALGLRLLVWHWREFYPLGGDEQEYLAQAVTLLQERRYVELRLMRPPLYGVFLAGMIVLFDSLVQHLRLVQAVISAATVIPVWLLTAEVARWYAPASRAGPYRAAALAALLAALSYTLAANATELLSETLFLFGLTFFFWLVVRAARPGARGRRLSAVLAGLLLGAASLTRAVALPLLPLGVLWLLPGRRAIQDAALSQSGTPPPGRAGWRPVRSSVLCTLLFVGCTVLVIAPWTARNYRAYGGLIVIDTTGAENLWLDNDPAGREAVKARLYALGDDRLTRQRLAAQEGLAAIRADPGRFIGKAWDELQAFFALEYADDMRNRRAIWIPPGEVWTRLLLGDGLWLLLVMAGSVGLWRAGPPALAFQDPRWICVPWVLYVVLTAVVFHVELRYRLPLYPVLLPYAGLALAGWRWRRPGFWWVPTAPRSLLVRRILPLATVAAILGLMLLHRPYPALAWQLGWKHAHLVQAEAALARQDSAAARMAAQAALARDPASVLARVALARAALQAGDQAAAERLLQEAIDQLPAHPQAHLLLGDLRRQQGRPDAALNELRYETASLQDLQQWGWHWFSSAPPPRLNVGGGRDLGFVQGFHAPEAGGWRWTSRRARMQLASTGEPAVLSLRLASGRPPGAARPRVTVLAGEQVVGRFRVAPGWRDYRLVLPGDVAAAPELIIEVRSETFTPRMYDPASADGRTLGIMVDQAGIWTSER